MIYYFIRESGNFLMHILPRFDFAGLQ